MYIASIDPGVTTGLVIALVTPRVNQVTIKPVFTEDHTSQAMVISRIRTHHCRNVFMEQKPSRPSKEGLDNWEWLFHRLLGTANYFATTNISMDSQPRNRRSVFLVQPSSWKPFMKNRMALLPKPLPHHARDAFSMLHYSIQINYPDKEIVYGT